MDPASSSSSTNQRPRIVSSGERPVMVDNGVQQHVSQEGERIVASSSSSSSIAPSSDPTPYYNVLQTPTNLYQYDWNFSHPGYAQSINTWDGYSPFATTPEGLHVPQVVHNDNSSLMYHPGYGFNPYPSLMLDGQIPVSPAYYPPFGAPPAMHYTPSDIDPATAYMIPFGQYGGSNFSGQGDTSLTSPMPYPLSMGILGPYDHMTSQVGLHGSGVASSSSMGGYYHLGSYQNPGSMVSYYGADNRVRSTPDTSKRREELASVSTSNDVYGNRGPRASSRVKNKSSSRPCSTTGDSTSDSSTAGPSPSTAGPNPSLYNHPEFVTEYKNAKFFVVKSFSEDNVHRSIKYNVWASTPHGNKKLDTAYRDAEKMGGNCPIFLFFSVNASGQFCGVSEMVGPVDFEKDAGYWQQDRWSGQFPVKWHIVKDVPNNRFCHILLQNNDNKPVTHSRDSQEVKLRQGNEMLRIFKEYEAQTSILDDFGYYDERERQQVGEDGMRKEAGEEESSVEQISERLQVVTVEDGKEGVKEELITD